MARPNRLPKQLHLDGVPALHPHAAGMGIGADEIVIAGPPDRDSEPVRALCTFTPDLETLVAWLATCGIDTLARESTGVYWVPISDLLEQHGIVPYLVNARHVKTVPGRKSDWNDAQPETACAGIIAGLVSSRWRDCGVAHPGALSGRTDSAPRPA